MNQSPANTDSTPDDDRTIDDAQSSADVAEARELVRKCDQLRRQVARVVVGQEAAIEQILIAILARGHCLLEGVPGLAKTLMIRTLADAMTLRFRRIQFTPDLMPSDITGTDMIQQDADSTRRRLVFEKGPVFTQMLLADEINRTPPKTQAALLEAMQEHEVTAAGKTYPLPEPFFVLATQNPIEQEGTYPLPEAQRDRFLFHVVVDYPTRDEESEIIDRTTATHTATVQPAVSGAEITRFQNIVRRVPLPPHVKDWVIDAVRSLRPAGSAASPATDSSSAMQDARQPQSPADWVRQWVQWGPGPRAGQQWVLAAKARAVLRGRTHVTLDDVRSLAHPVLRHRMVTTFAAEADGITVEDVITRMLADHPPPL